MSPLFRPTHKELVLRAIRWLKGTKGLPVALAEIGTDTLESPDAIGWTYKLGESWLIECKASRADFLADRKKVFRVNSCMGLGTYRLFAAPAGLIKPSELPPRWGLLEVRPKTIKILKKPERHELPVFIHMREKRLLISAIQRATEGWGKQVFK